MCFHGFWLLVHNVVLVNKTRIHSNWKWKPTFHQLVGNDTQCPDIGGHSCFSTVVLFWRNIGQCSHKFRLDGILFAIIFWFLRHSQTVIAYLHLSIITHDENILRFEVSVEDVLIVRIVDSMAGLGDNLQD